jgi:hypothetical protein
VTLGIRFRARPAYLVPSAELDRRLGVDPAEWERFSRHWNRLAPDNYAAELGTTRLRRYGHYVYSSVDGAMRLLPHGSFVQPERSNPLYVDQDRVFEPLADAFAREPLLLRLLTVLASVATSMEHADEWSAKVTPFRVLATADGGGDPTPEGPHRDGVTLVTTLLIGRDNAVGGESTVYDREGRPILRTTLSERGTMLLCDDRCTLHSVSPIMPLDEARPARRDVLVITFAPYR